jgi:hypothetical protein
MTRKERLGQAAKEYAKGVLRDLPGLDRDLTIKLAEILIHAYLRGRSDERAEHEHANFDEN